VERIELRGHGGDTIPAFLWPAARSRATVDRAEPARGIVLAHDVYGPRTALEAGERLAERGFAVCLPDLYGRGELPGPAPSADDPAPPWSADEIGAAIAGLPDRRAVGDLDAAAAELVARGLAERDRVGALGFCMGGNLAYLLGCTSTRVHAVVDLYGRIVYRELDANKPAQPLELALNLSAPFLGLFAGRDPGIPVADVERLRAVLSQAAKDFDIVIYPDAEHGFAHSRRGTFHADAAADAWRRVFAFLDEHLG
jgi:carboxymethylenebutenolidase